MNEEEMRYRVSAVVTSTLQIVVQARSAEEAEAFSDAIDFDKWSVLSTEHKTVDVSEVRKLFLGFQRNDYSPQGVSKVSLSFANSTSGPSGLVLTHSC